MNPIIALASVAISQAALTQPVQHPQGHSTAVTATTEETAIRDVLSRYKSAIERLDAAGTEEFFASDSAIFETGGVEGSYAQYLRHHLGPELKAFKSFSFSDYEVAVRFEGPIALATETYSYRIQTKSGEIAERRGVATSVLKKLDGKWKILSMHNSARKPKGS
ncbi:YybH family protein [Sphingomonas xanthus]|uniref:Nuclear transport factor 2 family protein n=1 Tax=Sphingomonas xanthus TaxID=2594473 RepID=A0A516INQ7_9SPHN|nr:nuclear transport factor 2 family protein [Sphingomonas xanthus]QDP18550.1 nuclear transport factor 2 family protein [Sphingomonas xanthus]